MHSVLLNSVGICKASNIIALVTRLVYIQEQGNRNRVAQDGSLTAQSNHLLVSDEIQLIEDCVVFCQVLVFELLLFLPKY